MISDLFEHFLYENTSTLDTLHHWANCCTTMRDEWIWFIFVVCSYFGGQGIHVLWEKLGVHQWQPSTIAVYLCFNVSFQESLKFPCSPLYWGAMFTLIGSLTMLTCSYIKSDCTQSKMIIVIISWMIVISLHQLDLFSPITVSRLLLAWLLSAWSLIQYFDDEFKHNFLVPRVGNVNVTWM